MLKVSYNYIWSPRRTPAEEDLLQSVSSQVQLVSFIGRLRRLSPITSPSLDFFLRHLEIQATSPCRWLMDLPPFTQDDRCANLRGVCSGSGVRTNNFDQYIAHICSPRVSAEQLTSLSMWLYPSCIRLHLVISTPYITSYPSTNKAANLLK